MWKLDQEDDFFRIFDKDRKIAGYFVPDYGDLPDKNTDELIEQMHKNHDPVPGGFLTVPMVKFGIFDKKEDMDILYLQSHISDAEVRIEAWKKFLMQNQMQHMINIAYTDPDMLSMTFPIKFAQNIPLEKKLILETISPTLDLLSQKGLL